MKRILMFAIVLVVAGCGDPENDRLSTGDQVIAIAEKGKTATWDQVVIRNNDAIWPAVPYGTHLMVVSDEADPERTWKSRDVLVHIEEGESKGKTGTLTRWNLRKVK